MKKVIAAILCICAVLSLCLIPAAAETGKTVKVTTPDKLITIELPNDSWYQLVTAEHNELFSDGDCAISVDLYKKGDTLPAIQTSDDIHELIYTSAASYGDYTLYVVGYAHSRDDFSAIGTAINSIRVISEEIDDSQTEHEINKDEYSIRQTNYIAWVTASILNVRAGSGTDTAIISSLKYGEQVTITGSVLRNGSDIGWLRIKSDAGVEGYVSAQFITTNQITPSGSSDSSSKNPYKVGPSATLYSLSGESFTIYLYSDSKWRMTDSGATFSASTGDTYVGSNGVVLYTYNPSALPARTGYSITLRHSGGSTVIAYNYSDGTWRDDSGIYYSRYNNGQWQSAYGEILDVVE